MLFEVLPPQPEPDPVVISVDVCSLYDRPEAFDGKWISVAGHFRTDWRHGALLQNYPCRKAVWIGGDEARWGEDWQRIQRTRETPEDEVIALSVVGRFEWNPGATGTYARTKVIHVEKITYLSIETP